MACKQLRTVAKRMYLLCSELGHVGIPDIAEWSRIEPEEGKICEDMAQHYVDFSGCFQRQGWGAFYTMVHVSHPSMV